MIANVLSMLFESNTTLHHCNIEKNKGTRIKVIFNKQSTKKGNFMSKKAKNFICF